VCWQHGEILAHTVTDEPIVLESDSRSEVRGDNQDNTQAPRILDGGQVGHNALELEPLPAPFIIPADEVKDRDNDVAVNDIDNNTSPRPAKRQRPTSPRYGPKVHCASTPSLSHNVDVEGSKENADGDSDGAGDENVPSKRRKLSDSPGGRTALSSHSPHVPHSRPSTSEDAKDDSESTCIEGNPTTTARTAPASEPVSLAEPQLVTEAMDADREWEVLDILGREDIDGVRYYWVKWGPTPVAAHLLGHAKELVDEFEARVQARRRDKSRRGNIGSKARKQAVEANPSGGQQQKKRRGRPRKQK
jgi:hypothetical protein